MLRDEELLEIKGGVSGAVITAVLSAIDKVFEMGRTLGTLIRRVVKQKYC